MIYPTVAVLLILTVLILLSDRLAQARIAIVRQTILRFFVILALLGTLFLWARYWIVYAVTCTPNCIGANLVGWDLEGVVLRNSAFVEANLRGATLNAADVYNADFSGANLAGVNFQNANLRSTRLVGALLTGADFRGAEFGDTDLRGAVLDESDLTRVDLTRTHLQGATFDRAKLVEVRLADKNLAGLSLVQADLTGADLAGADLSGSRLSGANLSGARLTGTDLAGTWLNLADLTGADLRNTNLAGANLLGANLASADLSNSNLVGANLIGAHINGTNLLGANLADSRLLASEVLPVDLLTDPLLQELNQLQQFEIITDVDLSGVQFNRQTKWPMGRTTLLAGMLGSQFLAMLPSISDTQTITDGSAMLTIVSNDATLPLSEALYREYEAEGNRQSVLLDHIASSTAFTAFCSSNNIHMVASNHIFPQDELTRCVANEREVMTFTVGIQALVVVVNPNNTFVNSLSTDELKNLATARRWSDVDLDWPRADIQRFIPDLETTSFQFWVNALYGGDTEAAERVLANFDPANNGALLVQGVNLDPYAIGILDYATYLQNASGLKLLLIDGQTPSALDVQQNTYKLTQPLYLFVDGNQLRQLPRLQEFLAFYFNNVNRFVNQVGLFAVSPEVLQDAQGRLDALRISDRSGAEQ